MTAEVARSSSHVLLLSSLSFADIFAIWLSDMHQLGQESIRAKPISLKEVLTGVYIGMYGGFRALALLLGLH